jgi:hypothetical protein
LDHVGQEFGGIRVVRQGRLLHESEALVKEDEHMLLFSLFGDIVELLLLHFSDAGQRPADDHRPRFFIFILFLFEKKSVFRIKNGKKQQVGQHSSFRAHTMHITLLACSAIKNAGLSRMARVCLRVGKKEVHVTLVTSDTLLKECTSLLKERLGRKNMSWWQSIQHVSTSHCLVGC